MQVKKRGQITLFIALGIVLIMVFGIVFFAINFMAKMALNQEADRIIEELVSTTAINIYVKTCLDDASKKAFTLAGEQGGVIYATQLLDEDGNPESGMFFRDIAMGDEFWELYMKNVVPYIPDSEEDDSIVNVSFGIGLRNDATPPLYLNAPEYPYTDQDGNLKNLESDMTNSPFAAPGVFVLPGGLQTKNKLIPLCSQTGSNAPGLLRRLLGLDPGDDVETTCKGSYPFLGHSPISVQNYLEKYIAKTVKQCVEFEEFAHLLGYNITEGDVEARVTFSEIDTDVEIDYPLNIYVRNTESVTRKRSFFSFIMTLSFTGT